jgi:tRNA modification GTPase
VRAERATIYALSSGSPPAAIAVVRISGSAALGALEHLVGSLPSPKVAKLAALRDAEGGVLDRALILRHDAPASPTGEDVAELHLHGGRAVVSAVLEALAAMPGLREAEPGEFTRRAFENGRIDLAEAEGLADLLAAETQSQRRAALAMAGGGLSRKVAGWRERLLALAAQVEAVIDFSDEGEVGEALPRGWEVERAALAGEIGALLSRPPAERLREGVRVVIAGPPNAGKSSLLNWLAGRQAAITSAIAGTTRDVIEAPTAIGGAPFLLVDTAGLRQSGDEIEAIGVGLAQRSIAEADMLLWLGDPAACPQPHRALIVQMKIDLTGPERRPGVDIGVSAETGEGMDELISLLVARARELLPQEGEVTANARQRAALAGTVEGLAAAAAVDDLVLCAESLRGARLTLDRIVGRSGVEDMLDALFGRFCLGK